MYTGIDVTMLVLAVALQLEQFMHLE